MLTIIQQILRINQYNVPCIKIEGGDSTTKWEDITMIHSVYKNDPLLGSIYHMAE